MLSTRTAAIAPKPVTDLIRPDPKPLYALQVLDAGGEAETFNATDDHPWKVEGKGWVETRDLKTGDRIDTGSGKDLVVTSLTLTSRVEHTYNLTVADWHTFMVGDDGAVVHNVDCHKTIAANLGFKLDRSQRFHGQDVFKKGSRLISRDVDRHNGGYWKMFDLKGNRLGTYNREITVRIGK